MTGSMQLWVEAMRAERYADAWAMQAASIAQRDPATRDDPSLPYHLRWVWDGSPVDGRDVLVRCYHGLGDTLQFARFLPLLAERARSVTLEVQLRLAPLLAGLGIDRLVPFDVAQPLPAADCDIEITELPCALHASPDVARVPYLSSPATGRPAGGIGICHTAGDWDAERSIPAALFETICRRHRCITLVSEATSLAVENPGGCPFDMTATAALVAGVDLVITVDTMIAHLAGAMGKPVWLLLKAEPDWRWTPGAIRSAWYPTMRVYTQPSPGDWPTVIAAVADELVAISHSRSLAAWPA